ncbi:tRNA lysidine(34) synthetase TilS [Roseibium sp. SCP14]|uniref:tRNA lysidine(34) synthetase TilS n=1 Tax=Roseibium sp. SCP14 TaxID=3141375 RepID=UPI003335FC5C
MRNVPDKPVEPAGLPADDVDKLFSVLKPFSKLTLAVSGGGDSLCLMTLFNEWRHRTGWTGEAEVVVVDHGLRPESEAEALFVVRTAVDAALPATVLCWEGEKPSRNIQEAARLARYRLISQHMRRSGSDALVLGHHLDDQAETFLDRLSRGSGLHGLSAMAGDEPDGPEGLRLLRPLLQVPRKKLEASLRERGLAWCSDPSNQDLKYKRSRLRKILALLAEEGLSAERISQTSAHLRRTREALDQTTREFAEKHLAEHPAGPLKLSRQAYRDLPEELRLRFLTLALGRATGVKPRVRLQKLQVLDQALMLVKEHRQTLAGALVKADEETIWCWREAGRTPPETLYAPIGEGIWDHRFRYSVKTGAGTPELEPAIRLGPLCHSPIQMKDIEWPQDWPREAFDCSPVVWSEGGEIYPHSCSVNMPIGEIDKGEVLNLARMPFRAKLMSNYLDEGDAERKI